MDLLDLAQLEGVQQGDERALTSLYERHAKVVYSVALRILRSPACAEDVLQEVFLLLWRNPERFVATRGELCPWLAVVSRNRAIDLLRRRRPMDRVEDHALASPYDLASTAESQLLCEKARRLSARLTAHQRSALDLAFFHGMTHAEIAASTGCPLGTVKTRIRSALRVLRIGLEVGTVAEPWPQ